ncbi:MAG: R3H domain-containing nucleic acid-binding protein [Candidatus Paceibacterota bacterium]|jgi:spoIIIJ-associated protein
MNKEELSILIKEFIEKTQHPIKEISTDDKDLNTVWCSVEINDPYLFLDRNGEGVFAVNHIIRKIIEKKAGDKEETQGVIIDINGFQKKRIDSVRSVAHMMAERARYFKSNIEVDPMPAFERRIIHEFLSDAQDLKTESEGEGKSRRVIIKYIGDL